jgi:hypothetical protein
VGTSTIAPIGRGTRKRPLNFRIATPGQRGDCDLRRCTYDQTSSRCGLGGRNQKNFGVRCLVAGAIHHEARSSRTDAHPRWILGNDIDFCVRQWAGRGARWVRRTWLKWTRRTLVGGIFFKALLGSINWTLDRALFCSCLRTSRPRSQRGGPNGSITGARESFCDARIRPAGVRPSAEGSLRSQAPPRFLPPA